MEDDCIGGHAGNRVDKERLILSEVHVGNSALDESEVVSRYAYITPGAHDHRQRDTGSTRSSSSSSSDSSDSEDHGSGITRRRKRHRSSPPSCQRRASRPAHEVLTVVHRMATTLDLVGQQVWSAAFLLGDFILAHEEIFRGAQVLELGAGPGVGGLVAARVARRCFLTDYHDKVLEVLARNAEANQHLFAHEQPSPADIPPVYLTSSAASKQSRRGAGQAASSTTDASGVASRSNSCHDEGTVEEQQRVVAVRKLDWFKFSTPEAGIDKASCTVDEDEVEEQSTNTEEQQEAIQDSAPTPFFAWRKGEIEKLTSKSEIGGSLLLIASDVIYDEGLTEALFNVLRKLPAPTDDA